MPINPTAPDYISQVRGVISDLRDNYVKKQQLYLQEKDQEDRIGLARAQFDLQVQNSNQQAALARSKLAAEIDSSNAQLAARSNSEALELARINASSIKARTESDLNERKFLFEQIKEGEKLKQEQAEREKETASGRLMQEGTVALNSDDPTKLIEWTNKLAGSILSQKQRNDVFTNALSLVDAKKRLEQEGVNIKTQPKALQIVQNLNMMNVDNLAPDELAAKINELTDSFRSLKNTDPKINDLFMSVSQEVAKRQHDFRQKEYGQVFDSFLRSGDLAQLDQSTQAEYDKLQSEYPEGPSRASNDYSVKLKRLMFKSNEAASVNALQSLAKQADQKQEDLINRIPALAAVRTDPETGAKYRAFPFEAPDLTPVIGFNGTIDPDTGLINKNTIRQYEKWVAEITSPSYVLGQVPFTQGLSFAQNQTVPAVDEKTLKTVSSLPFRPANPSKFTTAEAPGTVRIATTPVADRVKISDATISAIVSAYRQNPDAIIYGRPAKEIIANLKAKGYTIPEVPVTPTETR